MRFFSSVKMPRKKWQIIGIGLLVCLILFIAYKITSNLMREKDRASGRWPDAR